MASGVFIKTNIDLDSFYNGIKGMLDARYHSPGNAFPNYSLSEDELAEIATNSAMAHGSDKADSSLYINGVHIERLIR